MTCFLHFLMCVVCSCLHQSHHQSRSSVHPPACSVLLIHVYLPRNHQEAIRQRVQRMRPYSSSPASTSAKRSVSCRRTAAAGPTAAESLSRTVSALLGLLVVTICRERTLPPLKAQSEPQTEPQLQPEPVTASRSRAAAVDAATPAATAGDDPTVGISARQ